MINDADASGIPVSTVTFGISGELIAAVRYGVPPVVADPITEKAAIARARAAAESLALATAGHRSSGVDESTGGWIVRWDRVENDVPVAGDATIVRLWADGTISGVASSHSVLGPTPGTTLTGEAARSIVVRNLESSGDPAASSEVTGASLAWVSPNGLFDSTVAPPAETPLQLAWVVKLKPRSGSVQELAVYVNAESGALIGGDAVE